MGRFDLVSGESTVRVSARTTINTVTMSTSAVVGALDAETTDHGVFLAVTSPPCRIQVPVSELRSGNPLFDHEGQRRFDAAHYPLIGAELMTAIPLGEGVHLATWRLEFHGATHDLDGHLLARAADDASIIVESQCHFDVRHWGVEPGRFLAIQVHPEASFEVRLRARRSH